MSKASEKPPFGPQWSSTDEERWRQLEERRERAQQAALREPLLRLALLATSGPVEAEGLTDWLITNCHEVTKALLPWCARARREGLNEEPPR